VIHISIDQVNVATGDFVSGRVHWTADGVRRPRRIIAAAVWETAGSGNPRRGVGRAMQFVPRRDQRDATFPFRLMIPHEGPVTFAGQLLAIVWKVRVRVDQVGLDEFAESEFHVEPRKRRHPTPA
jgi:hypothetical protein